MKLVEKIVRADETRPTRLHTQAGEFCGLRALPGLVPAAWTWLRFWITGRRVVQPWWVWDAIGLINREIRSTDRLLEAGSGYSSLWLAERCDVVHSIEESKEWSQLLRSEVLRCQFSNVEIIETRGTLDTFSDMLSKAIANNEPYDVVVIDSPGDRTAVFKVLTKVAPPWAPRLIIYDNTDRPDDRRALLAFDDLGYEKRRFLGFGPQLVHASETAVLVRRAASCVK